MEENNNKIELVKKSFDFKQQKKYAEALECLYQALECTSDINDKVELLSQIGELHFIMCNYDKALEEFNKTIAMKEYPEFSLQKCYEIYIKTQQYQKALKTAQRMTEANKTSKNYYNYINALIKLNNNQDAIEVFNSLDEEIKLDSDILYLISTIMKEKEEQLLERALALDSTNEKVNLAMAKIAYEKQDYQKVIQLCINLDENNPLASYYLAMIEFQRKNYIRAIELLINAIAFDNNEHDFYFDLAKVYIETCWFDEALGAIKKSINLAINKKDTKTLDEKFYLAGWVLIKQNKFSNALLNLNSIKEDSKVYPDAQILIQIINIKNLDLAKAKSKLEELYQKESNNLILLDTLALTYKELKLYKNALETYNKALTLYPDSIYYTLEIIDLLIDLKRYDEALEKIGSFIKIYENCPSVYNSLARVYYRLNKFEEALNALNRYLELDSNKAETYYFKGLVLNDLSKFSEAISSIYNAINLKPDIAKYYSQMARSYLGIKEYHNAILYAKEAIELDQKELNYKKQAYEISLLIGDERQIAMYKNQLERSEKIFKLDR